MSVRGSLEAAAGERLPDREIEILLPAEYGLGGLDHVLNEPEDFGNQDRVYRFRTDSKGEFAHALGKHLFHITCWILPPVGCFPDNPPPPFFLVRFPSLPGEYYAVWTRDGDFKVFTSGGQELPLAESRLAWLRASAESGATDEGAWTVGVLHLRFARPHADEPSESPADVLPPPE